MAHRQQPVLVAPDDERRRLHLVEVDDPCGAVAHRREHVVDDTAADRRARQQHRLLGGDEVPAGHDVAHPDPAEAGPREQPLVVLDRRARGHLRALEQPDDPLDLAAVALLPAAAGRDRDHAARAAALGQLERQRPAHRVAGEVRGADAEPVEQRLEVVGPLLDRARVTRWHRASVMAVQRWSDHLEARHQQPEHGQPAAPRGREAVDQDQRLAGPGAVEGGGELGHTPILRRWLAPCAGVAARGV